MLYPRSLRRGIAVFLALCVFLITLPSSAQQTTADVTGRVVDPNGAVVVNATVTARNTGTNLTRTAQTNESGEYTISELPPGTYELSVEAANFSRALVRNLELNVGTRQTLNFNLTAGQVTETVEVSGSSVLVETTRSDIGGVVTPVEVENLPLLNRTFANLAVIMPEARPAGNFDPTKTRVGNVAFNGGDGRQVDVNVDGGDNKDNVVGSLLQNFSYESIQEFQVLQHRWTAEQGRAVGGVVNVITKSGSNDLRGSFFFNFRNESMRANDFFENQRRAADPSFRRPNFTRHEIGGSIGGPILRDRLFYFFALERFRERQNVAVSQAALTQLSLIPGAQAVSEIPTPYNDTLLTARVDHRLTDNQSMFYRFAFQQNDSPNDQVANPATTDLSGGNFTNNRLSSFVVNHTANIGATRVNQFVFHFQDFSNEILGVTTNPRLTFPGGIEIGPNVNTPQATLERKYQFRDDFTMQVGNHGLKFGGNYIYTDLGGYFFFGSSGYTVNFFDTPSVITSNTTRYPQGFATPGAVQSISFATGEASHDQLFHQLAFYVQDDWRVRPNLTLNLGLRWDANIGNLPDQTNNRTFAILRQLNDPRAQALTSDPERLSRSTPNWLEFQPRVGFAYDPTGSGRTVIRGGYGIFYDQLFQNLTIFGLAQSGAEIYQTVLNLTNTAVGVGQLPNFRFGTDPLPGLPPGFSISELGTGSFGRITDPEASEPYVQKFSIGFETQLGRGLILSSDYVHTLGLFEPRVQVINPRIENICNPLYPGSTPSSPRCVRGVNSRYFDLAFVQAGLPANRLEQINMIGTTNRSLYDSWTTTLRGRRRNMTFSLSYVLSNSRSWGGQPVASYTGNGIATTPENQFRENEFGPTRFDERHRIVASGVFDLPYGFQLAPVLQLASARPYSPTTGVDIDGDGLATNDRLCEGVDPLSVLQAVLSRPAGVTPTDVVRSLNPRGCTQARVNSMRGGFIVRSDGTIEERSGRFFNFDLRVGKNFTFGERYRLSTYVDFYNLFNTENLAFSNRFGLSPATNQAAFLQPVSLFGPGFGPPVGRPFTMQLGARFTF
jgi:hypothetical protein